MRVVKWLLFAVAVMLAMAIVLSGASYYMAQRQPDWYGRPKLTDAQQQLIIAHAQTTLSQVQQLAADLRAYEARRQHAMETGTTLPADQLPPPLAVELSDEELNALFQRFAASRGWDSVYSPYMSDPVLLLQDGQVLLGGKVKSMGDIVASVYFDPSIDPTSGDLHFDLASVMAGRLPLPDVAVSAYRQKLVDAVGHRLPAMQQAAKFDHRGVPNDATVQAWLAELLLASIDHAGTTPVLFLPLLGGHGSVPVKLTGVHVTDGKISLTLAPMTQDERAAMLSRLRDPSKTTPTASASAN